TDVRHHRAGNDYGSDYEPRQPHRQCGYCKLLPAECTELLPGPGTFRRPGNAGGPERCSRWFIENAGNGFTIRLDQCADVRRRFDLQRVECGCEETILT